MQRHADPQTERRRMVSIRFYHTSTALPRTLGPPCRDTRKWGIAPPPQPQQVQRAGREAEVLTEERRDC